MKTFRIFMLERKLNRLEAKRHNIGKSFEVEQNPTRSTRNISQDWKSLERTVFSKRMPDRLNLKTGGVKLTLFLF